MPVAQTLQTMPVALAQTLQTMPAAQTQYRQTLQTIPAAAQTQTRSPCTVDSDRLSFPHQVQPLPREVPQHEQVPPLPNHEQVPFLPHHPVHQHEQVPPLPHQLSTPPQPSPAHHLDIMNILSWQNEQLAKLQDQVARLLAASPQAGQQTHGQAVQSVDSS